MKLEKEPTPEVQRNLVAIKGIIKCFTGYPSGVSLDRSKIAEPLNYFWNY